MNVFTVGMLGLSLIWCSRDPVVILSPVTVIAATFTCGLWCFAILWSKEGDLPRELRMGRLLVVCRVLFEIVVTIF